MTAYNPDRIQAPVTPQAGDAGLVADDSSGMAMPIPHFERKRSAKAIQKLLNKDMY